MATVESLDLASLQNNPQSIAEALEDALETTDGTIGQLKTDAQSKKDDIDDLYDDALTAKNNIDDILEGTDATEFYHASSLDNSWTAWNVGSTLSTEQGINIQRYGKIYIMQILAFKGFSSTATNQSDTMVTISSSDMTLPSDNVNLGVNFSHLSSNDDRTYRIQFLTNGNIVIHFNNHDGTTMYVHGNFMGVDPG
jgi:hypothetical protein